MARGPRILVIGGYGVFGRRVAERLAREADLDIIVAGRSMQRALESASALRVQASGTVRAAAIDATAPDETTLQTLAPAVVINASGPFQSQDYTLARAAVAVGAHYVDLADSTDFVLGLSRDQRLDARARARRVLVTSGASSVPAISGAVLDSLAKRFARITVMRHAISPGNSFDPGPATTASIVGAIGRPFRMKRDGAWITVHGWQGLTRRTFLGVGMRWLGHCNVPDLTLFAERYPDLQTIDFRAGVEVSLFHMALWALSWPARWGMLRGVDTHRLAGPLLAAKRWMPLLGSDVGCMFVEIEGVDAAGVVRRVEWQLVARQGHGPYIPATPAVILARKLARGELAETGARACVGLVTLAEIERELADLEIWTSTT